jgi:hypothetical protein
MSIRCFPLLAGEPPEQPGERARTDLALWRGVFQRSWLEAD